MVEVVWSKRSLANLAAIFGYVAKFSPKAATRLYEQIYRAAESLGENPDRGRAKGKVRELVVITPYVVRYRVEPDRVVIVRIRHGARRPL